MKNPYRYTGSDASSRKDRVSGRAWIALSIVITMAPATAFLIGTGCGAIAGGRIPSGIEAWLLSVAIVQLSLLLCACAIFTAWELYRRAIARAASIVAITSVLASTFLYLASKLAELNYGPYHFFPDRLEDVYVGHRLLALDGAFAFFSCLMVGRQKFIDGKWFEMAGAAVTGFAGGGYAGFILLLHF